MFNSENFSMTRVNESFTDFSISSFDGLVQGCISNGVTAVLQSQILLWFSYYISCNVWAINQEQPQFIAQQ